MRHDFERENAQVHTNKCIVCKTHWCSLLQLYLNNSPPYWISNRTTFDFFKLLRGIDFSTRGSVVVRVASLHRSLRRSGSIHGGLCVCVISESVYMIVWASNLKMSEKYELICKRGFSEREREFLSRVCVCVCVNIFELILGPGCLRGLETILLASSGNTAGTISRGASRCSSPCFDVTHSSTKILLRLVFPQNLSEWVAPYRSCRHV